MVERGRKLHTVKENTLRPVWSNVPERRTSLASNRCAQSLSRSLVWLGGVQRGRVAAQPSLLDCDASVNIVIPVNHICQRKF